MVLTNYNRGLRLQFEAAKKISEDLPEEAEGQKSVMRFYLEKSWVDGNLWQEIKEFVDEKTNFMSRF